MAKRTSPGPIGAPRVPSSQALGPARPIADNTTVEAVLLDDSAEFGSTVHALDVFESRLLGARLTGIDITESVFRDVEILDAELSGAKFNESRWSRVSATRSRMSGFTAPALRLEDVVFRDCRLDGASFRGSVGERVAFVGCDLTDADFTQAKLTTCVFVCCDLSRSDFTSATLRQVSLTGSTLNDVRGVTSMSGVSVDVDHLLPLALAALGTLGIRVLDDDPLAATLLGSA
jgi:uncharacterized protein YjbI with pentapeptide repeats